MTCSGTPCSVASPRTYVRILYSAEGWARNERVTSVPAPAPADTSDDSSIRDLIEPDHREVAPAATSRAFPADSLGRQHLRLAPQQGSPNGRPVRPEHTVSPLDPDAVGIDSE